MFSLKMKPIKREQIMLKKDLTDGPITRSIILFSIPMILGNILQQLYNVADTFIVGKYLGAKALAAVGSAYTLMIFLTSILLGLCMGSSAVISMRWGEKDEDRLKNSIFISFLMIAVISIVINALSFLFLDQILILLQVPEETYGMMREYLEVILIGISFTFLYNYFASLLRAVGNSSTPLVFLAISAILNVVLDVYFIAELGTGVKGAAVATVISQAFSAFGILIYVLLKEDVLKLKRKHMYISRQTAKEILHLSMLTCIQQSVMNFGILMVQGLVNSFGTVVMAAFAVAVKIDSFAYMPVQDFGNAFSVFTAQNFGANKTERIRKGMKDALCICVCFSLVISFVVCLFARPLMGIFIADYEKEILAIGIQYLRIEGAFYIGIGCLFLLYGYYRGIKRPGMSVLLTVISLGIRVALAYLLASIPTIGYVGIWWAIPIGWFLADAVGFAYYIKSRRKEG